MNDDGLRLEGDTKSSPCAFSAQLSYKPLKNILLLESWYVAFETPAYHSLFELWLWGDIDLYLSKVKFCNGLFCRKRWKQFIGAQWQPMALKLVYAENWLSYSRSRSFTYETYRKNPHKPVDHFQSNFVCTCKLKVQENNNPIIWIGHVHIWYNSYLQDPVGRFRRKLAWSMGYSNPFILFKW